MDQGSAIPEPKLETELKGAKGPTCTEEGYAGDEICTVCGRRWSKERRFPRQRTSMRTAVVPYAERLLPQRMRLL